MLPESSVQNQQSDNKRQRQNPAPANAHGQTAGVCGRFYKNLPFFIKEIS